MNKYFTDQQLDLIEFVNKTKRINRNGNPITWLQIAKKFGILPAGSDEQRRKAANDIWRRYKRSFPELERTEVILNKDGQEIKTVFKKHTGKSTMSTEGFEIEKITKNPYGSEWVTYKKTKEETPTLLAGLEKLMEKYPVSSQKEIKEFEEIAVRPQKYIKLRYLAVVNLYDAHLDKIPVKSTCGVESTLEENIRLFKEVVTTMGDTLRGIENNEREALDKIILPIGNDLFHTNGFNSLTKKGTQLEYYCNPEEAYYTICDAITWAVQLFSKIAPVKVLMIKGNHDEDKITTLGYWLDRYFQNNENIEVDYTRRQRKYIKYGENLIGFAHGDKEKMKMQQLPLIMAQEAKEYWGNTTHRKMYLGDLHHGFEYQFLKSKDHPGVEVEYLRSCGTTDTWHEDFGWIGVPKTGYLQLFDYDEGEAMRIKYPIKKYE